MPRIRTIKPEFPMSESMGRVSRDARLLFILMWTQADDAGRLRASPILLANTLMPYDSDAFAKIPEWLDELSRENCIRLYEVDGNHYLDIAKWAEHQRIDHPTASKLPAFESKTAKTREDSRELREDSRVIREDSDASAGARADRDREGKGREGRGESITMPCHRDGAAPSCKEPLSPCSSKPETQNGKGMDHEHSPEFLAVARRLAEARDSKASMPSIGEIDIGITPAAPATPAKRRRKS